MEGDCFYFHNLGDGRIVGQVHKIAHTKVWLSKIVNNYNDETYLGQYISSSFAKSAIEMYWDVQERTLIE